MRCRDLMSLTTTTFTVLSADMIDYGYRGIHLTNQTARQLINRYYAAPPAHSYFMGCSNGGRQTLMAAQRFPEDFDGILAGAPANDFTGLKLSQAHRMQALKDQPLDLEEVADNIEKARTILDATDPDLSAFQAAGGKLLSYFGWSDPDINPLTAIAYRDAVASTLKQEVADFYQLFMVPGMFHCSGGPGASDFDAITPLINWVEAGIMPARIEAQHLGANATGFSRPLCAYPAVARPIADGDRASSLSYECQTPTASQ
jgi:pimeloyl-ACP methyl ester carboxylesterase